MTLTINKKTYEAGELIAYVKKLEKRCANYEMTISKMGKGTCDVCRETEKDKRLADLIKENAELKEKYVKNITDCEICDTYCNSLLIKVKELLKKMYYLYFDPCVTNKDLENRDKLFEEVKQFIKE
jgi:hypothetical protein